MGTTEFSLTDLQGWMQQMLTGVIAANQQPVAARIADVVQSSSRLSAAKHLGIYQGSYIARLRECMRNQFAALAYALGNELFEAFTDDYLATWPSHSYTLNDLGENFGRYLEETRPDAEQEQKESWPDFMIELARFEYTLSLIFDEHAEEYTSPATEATPDEELRPAPVFHLFHHRFPICKYYLDFNQKKEPELPFPGDSYCVVTRSNYRLGLFVIKQAQYELLSGLKLSHSIATAKAGLAAKFGFAPADVENVWQEWRKQFIGSGFFVINI